MVGSSLRSGATNEGKTPWPRGQIPHQKKIPLSQNHMGRRTEVALLQGKTLFTAFMIMRYNVFVSFYKKAF